jgi:methyl-accepting chemotaxis protein
MADILHLSDEIADLARQTRLNAINLAVLAAKVKLSDPGFRDTNERIMQLVTRATEAASGVDRITQQMSGQTEPRERQGIDEAALERLEACVLEVEHISGQIVREIRQLLESKQPKNSASI